jgi:hypothetical protein
MASIEAILAITAGLVGILTLFVLFSTGSVIAVLALWLVVALIILVLWYYGFISFADLTSDLTPKPEVKPTPKPTPAPATTTASGPKVGSEVFHIDDSQFTYTDAPAVCAAYGAELATLEQIIEAYNYGAEWCSYGWSAGGFALYPTQKATWTALQAEPDTVKRTACGRPGVNGGYFDPNTKFGVNCFGFKPAGKADLPLPPPGTDRTAFKKAVAKFRAMIASFNLTPYSRSEWSGYDSTIAGKTAKYGTQFSEGANSMMGGNTKETFEQADQSVVEAPETSSAYTAAPYGLRGDQGPPGPPGSTGAASTVPGPAGPAGPLGPPGSAGPAGPIGGVGPAGAQGIQGIKGDQGLKGDKGDRGLQGLPGTAGSSIGVVGPKGDKGDMGPAGPKGDQGAQGVAGSMGMKGDPGAPGLPGAFPNKVPIVDTRRANDPPTTYYSKGMGKYDEFKHTNVVGLPSSYGEYAVLETTVPWWDPSGGPVIQSTPNGFWRTGTGSLWGSWMDSPGKMTGLSTLTASSSSQDRVNAYYKDFPGSEQELRLGNVACSTGATCASKHCGAGRCQMNPTDFQAYGFR